LSEEEEKNAPEFGEKCRGRREEIACLSIGRPTFTNEWGTLKFN
jgi:hypothetical protein